MTRTDSSLTETWTAQQRFEAGVTVATTVAGANSLIIQQVSDFNPIRIEYPSLAGFASNLFEIYDTDTASLSWYVAVDASLRSLVTYTDTFYIQPALTGSALRLTATPTANRVVTIQDQTHTLVGRNTTDTLTNKTITSLTTGTTVSGRPVAAGSGADPPAANAMGLVNRTAQAAAIAATNLTDTVPAGFYQILYEMTCTTGDATAGTMTFDVIATGDGGAQTVSSAALPLTTATLSATNPVRGSASRYLASGNVQYSTTLTGAVNAARYALRARCLYLG